MQNFIFTKTAAFLLFIFTSILANPLNAQRIYALSGNELISFEASTPGTVHSQTLISGIAAGQTLVGIDFRPQTGQLYGLGYNSGSGEARLYIIQLQTGMCTAVGSAPFSVAPNMGDITFDFNPTVDRIRLMGSNNQNYRLHPETGVVVATDGMLQFAATDANNAQDPEIVSGTYINSFIASTSTTLFNYDKRLNILTSQIPPNNGTQNTIGSSGIQVNQSPASASLDAYFNPITKTNTVYMVAKTNTDALYTINTTTGAATLVGNTNRTIKDISVQITRSVNTLRGDLVYGLTTNNLLISFDAMQPDQIRSVKPISGLMMGQTLMGMDFRPLTGELFGIGYNSTSGDARLYTIQLSSGVATLVGTTAISLPPQVGKIGFDFNPTVDRIRLTTSSDMNLRLNPITGMIAATDASLAFLGTDVNAAKNPSIGAVAYTNSFTGSTSTTLYNFDDSLNILTTQIPPNDGKLNTIGVTGIMQNTMDPSSDLDIYTDRNTGMNRAYLSANTGTSSFDQLYQLNLQNGAATLIGSIGLGVAVTDIAVYFNTETACRTRTTGCIKFELISIRLDSMGNQIVRTRVTNNCTSDLKYIAFQIQNGTNAIGPLDQSTYFSPIGNAYMLQTPALAPFRSVRFTPVNGGIKNGQSDIFEYTLPKITSSQLFMFYAKTEDGNSYDTYMNFNKCLVSGQLLKDEEITDRAESNTLDIRLYPNPTAGDLFMQSALQTEQAYQITVIDLTGRVLISNYETTAGTQETNLSRMIDSLANGIYLVRCTSADGQVSTKKLMIQR